MKSLLLPVFVLFFFSLSISVFAQNPQTTPTPKPADEQTDEDKEIVRISSQLVLVDALVLDKDGKQVTDLSAEDFELFQDGKPQKIINFAYVDSGKSDATTLPKTKPDKKSLPVPPISVRSNQGRVITFVIDDGNCLATPEGLEIARDAMRKFINEQMLPDDKVAIYRTRGGSSLLQLYSSNKEVLKRIVSKVNWFPSACGSAFDPAKINSNFRSQSNSGTPGQGTFENESDKQFRKDRENNERENQVVGTVGVLNFVVERLKNLPQRKLVFFISEGIPIPFASRALDVLREVADKASLLRSFFIR